MTTAATEQGELVSINLCGAASGFEWLDEPVCEEGAIDLYAPAQ